ncbi:apolipoprotein M [Hyperolius riggenbachi]|uniref:apolipoprotein M n=1 Tax=Hyperolius riggenbachi TaxID=752182 RepID=UPI0035A325AD
MLVSAWRYFLYLYGILLDCLSICNSNDRLSPFLIVTSQFPVQYMGRWHFLAAAAEPGNRALDIFTVMDNAQFTVQETEDKEKMVFRASIRIKDGSCVPRRWIYILHEGTTELRTEGHPDRLTELYACPCSDCIILKETDNSTNRLLLYSRSPQLEENCMKQFKQMSRCEGYKDVLMIPQTLEPCHLEA